MDIVKELIEDKTQNIQELEAVKIRLKEEIEKRKKSEGVLEAFFKPTTSLVVILDRNYNIIRVNDAYAKACSRNVSDYPGHNYFEFFPSDAKEIFDKVVRTKEPYKVLARPLAFPEHPEWRDAYWDWKLVPVLGSSGEVDLLVFTQNNVTENVRVKEKLHESEERYRTIFNNSLDGIILNLPNGKILSANPSACRMFGRTEEELYAVRRDEIVDLDDPRFMRAFKEREKTGSFNSEMTLLRKDGTKFPGEVTSNLFMDKSGNILSSMLVRDITERKNSEEALRLSEEKFSKAFYNSQAMMSITRFSDNKFINVNKNFSEILGYNRTELLDKCLFELNIWADLKERQDMLKQLFETGCVKNFEMKFSKKSGEIIFAIASADFLDLNGDKCLLASFIDITERKKTEEALRLSRELFFKAFNANPLLMAIVAMNSGKFVEVNETFTKKNGYTKEELIEHRMTDINYWVDLSERCKFNEEIAKKGFMDNFEARFRNKSGEISTYLLSGVIISWKGEDCILAISNDVTELRRYQNEIARLDRLYLIGEMAAGISHEIRNPMTTVRGFLQLFMKRDRYAQDKADLNIMIDELDRANSIITEFLSLAKDKAIDLGMQSLNKKILALLPLLQADAMKDDKTIKLELGNIPCILFDKDEIHQLILNLGRNGLEAMLPGGYITIKTFKESDRVVLAVQDQGKGIAPEVLERIGTPFFTTKDNSTGLGLAICYSIAQRHNARIDVETGSTGTTFYVRFKA